MKDKGSQARKMYGQKVAECELVTLCGEERMSLLYKGRLRCRFRGGKKE